MASASGTFLNADVDTIETLAEIPTAGAVALAVQFTVATADLTDFAVEGRVHLLAGYSTLASVTGDFTTPVFPIQKASSDLNVAAAGATVHFFIMDCCGMETVRIRAAGASSPVTGWWRTI